MTIIETEALDIVRGGVAPAQDPNHTRSDTRDDWSKDFDRVRDQPGDGPWQGDPLDTSQIGRGGGSGESSQGGGVA